MRRARAPAVARQDAAHGLALPFAVLDHDVLVDGFAANGRNPIDDASVVLTVANGRVVFDA